MDSNQLVIKKDHFSLSHLGTVALVAVLLLGASWMKDPQLFSFGKNSALADNPNTPHYYAYVPPAEDMQPEVAGASTDAPLGPSVINEDGTVSPVDMGQVLGASVQGVQLSLNDIQVNAVPDSEASIKKYFTDSENLENGPVDSSDFEAALSSGDQNLINQQAQKLSGVRDGLAKLPVPQSLVQLHKLTIAQYSAGIGVLQNFTQADQNPQLVGQYLNQFLKSQQDLDTENMSVAEKFGALDPESSLYVAPDGTPLPTPTPLSAIDTSGNSQSNLNTNLDTSNAGQ